MKINAPDRKMNRAIMSKILTLLVFQADSSANYLKTTQYALFIKTK